LEMEREGNRGSKGDKVSRLYATKKWGTGGTDKGQSGKGSSDTGTGVGNREEEIWERLEEKDMAIQQTGLDSDELRSGDLGVEGEGRDGKATREVFEVGSGGRREDARILDKRRGTEGEVKD